MKYLPSRICTLLIGVSAVLGGVSALACDVPVFRYALERWRPGVYRVLVYHRGTLSEDQQAILKPLEALSVDRDGPGNFSVERVDLEGKANPDALVIFKAQQRPALPWMVVCYPENDPSIACAWAGPLTAANIGLMADSPTRKTIARHLIGGGTAVWMLLASGEAALDDPAEKTLRTELKRLESELKLPDDPAAPTDAQSLKVAFSVVRLAPDDAAETVLRGTLLARDPELARRREPIVFPVFGRGRALCALVGKQMIARENIEAAAKFLTGPCSCEAKEQNPGMDLLMSADWSAAFAASKAVESQLPTLGPPLPEQRPAVTPVAVVSAPSGKLYRNLLVTFSVAAIAIVGIGLAMSLRGRRTEN